MCSVSDKCSEGFSRRSWGLTARMASALDNAYGRFRNCRRSSKHGRFKIGRADRCLARPLFLSASAGAGELYGDTHQKTSGAISGSTHETPADRGGGVAARTLFATLSGRRNEGAVQFTKTYDDGIPHNHPISYEGALADNGAEIEGRWSIPRTWSGRFLMIRSAPNAGMKIVRKKYERILI